MSRGVRRTYHRASTVLLLFLKKNRVDVLFPCNFLFSLLDIVLTGYDMRTFSA